MSKPTTLFGVIDAAMAEGKAASSACQDKAERQGWDAGTAAEFILQYLRTHGETAGEILVSEASKVNAPHDARAFGAVFLRLKRSGAIESCGYTRRAKGHGTHGGLVWKITSDLPRS